MSQGRAGLTKLMSPSHKPKEAEELNEKTPKNFPLNMVSRSPKAPTDDKSDLYRKRISRALH